jgi:hypothetical protein
MCLLPSGPAKELPSAKWYTRGQQPDYLKKFLLHVALLLAQNSEFSVYLERAIVPSEPSFVMAPKKPESAVGNIKYHQTHEGYRGTL